MLPTPHTSYRLVELHHIHLHAEFTRMRKAEESPIRLTPGAPTAWDDLQHGIARWRSRVRWPRRWRWSSA